MNFNFLLSGFVVINKSLLQKPLNLSSITSGHDVNEQRKTII